MHVIFHDAVILHIEITKICLGTGSAVVKESRERSRAGEAASIVM